MSQIKVLSLDGGGTRGYLTAVLLHELELKLGAPLHEVFDLIVGTSTGSILASGISSGLETIEMIELYQNFASKIFERGGARWWDKFKRTFSQGIDSPKYGDQNLEKVFRIAYGNLKFGHLLKPTLITSYNLKDCQPLIFKSFDERYKKIPVWEIVKSSTSAPIYFPAHILELEGESIPLIDGGVVANNPAMVAITEAHTMLGGKGVADFNDIVVASFGTGSKKKSVTSSQATKWGLVGWIASITDILFEGNMDSIDYMAEEYLGENYYRFQTELFVGSPEMDDATHDNLRNLALDAKHFMLDGGEELMDKLVEKLKDN